ncbi:hypothetical protein C8F01DRAFT_1370601 [Mycena amicta]|nr:hypothetical protein C8F01DRAFT_1370601 [Mycena amicta]
MDGPRLPRELEREIFELAAQSPPSTVAVLLRVAHRVQEWTEPFLYRTIRVRTSQSFEAFQHVLRTKPPNFLAASVRHVLFEAREGCTDEICLEIISKCPGITHIGTTVNFTGPKALDAFQTLPNLTHLTASLCDLFSPEGNSIVGKVNPAHPVFARVTHLIPLDEIHHRDGAGREICVALSRMPSLTHLRLDQDGLAPADVEHLLCDCLRLEVLLLVTDTKYSITSEGYPTAESRLVWGLSGDRYSYESFWNEWERTVNGLVDPWALAEALVKERSQSQATCNNRNEWLWFGSDGIIERPSLSDSP